MKTGRGDRGNGNVRVASVPGHWDAPTQREGRSSVTAQVGGAQVSRPQWEWPAIGASGGNVQTVTQN